MFNSPSELDWENAMTRTQASAEKTAERSDRILRGVADLLEQHRAQGRKLHEMTDKLDRLHRLSETLGARVSAIGHQPAPEAPRPVSRLFWPLSVALFVAGLCVGHFAPW